MKMKLFEVEGSKKVHKIEEMVNEWLDENPGIEILEIKQSTSGGSFADTKFYISIWYK